MLFKQNLLFKSKSVKAFHNVNTFCLNSATNCLQSNIFDNIVLSFFQFQVNNNGKKLSFHNDTDKSLNTWDNITENRNCKSE